MAKRQSVRRDSFRVFIGEGDAWSLSDPGHPIVSEADHRARYTSPGTHSASDAIVLADVASDLAYLIYTCPTTKLACKKLAAMRAAVRKLGPVEPEGGG